MKIVVWSTAGSALLIGLACGGNVVVDGSSGSEGGGGSQGTTTSSIDGGGGAGASCPFPIPVTVPQVCGGSASAGVGAPTECGTVFCDALGNNYTSQCSGSTCLCQFNGRTVCSCAVTGTTDICSAAAPSCCPFPFAQ